MSSPTHRSTHPWLTLVGLALVLGIAAFEISINGAVTSNESPSDSKTTLATLNTNCPTLAPGRNIIEVRAQDNAGGWSDSAQTTVFLVDENPPADTTPPLSTETPATVRTAIPTLTATPGPHHPDRKEHFDDPSDHPLHRPVG